MSLVLGESESEEAIHVLLFQLCVDWFSDSVELPHCKCENISAVISPAPFHMFFLSSANDLKVRRLLPTGPEAGVWLKNSIVFSSVSPSCSLTSPLA